jgi:N-acetylmuramoyl-L-alanine amidase
MIRIAIIISLLFFTTLLSISANGQLVDEDRDKPLPVGRLFDEAKFYHNQLQTNSKISVSRDNWLKGTRNFRRIYLSNPKSEFAPSCLFLLGRIYGEMYDRFQNGLDLDESISYFQEITKLFPQHRLADDAFLALGQLSLEKKNNPQQAADYLSEIVSNYPNGDMHPEAENLLKVLSLEHDIALPKIMVSSSRDNKLSYVLPVKYWSSDNYTRVVMMASGPVNYKEILLEETDNTPRRLYIDFKKSYIEPQYRSPIPIEDGLLKRIRTGQFSPDTVRVVLDIESISSYKIYSLPDPFRVVIDVRGEKIAKDVAKPMSTSSIARTDARTDKKNVKLVEGQSSDNVIVLRDNKKNAVNIKLSSEPAKIEPGKIIAVPEVKPLSLAQQLGLGVKKIVLDPGHGGKDPGAIAFGLKEKDIVLDVAKRLSPILKKELGCEVVLTRKDDTFISLEERTALANTNNADLFISLHINAHTSAKVRGMETYYLNLTTNAEAMRVAARENATSTHQMSELQDILSDIMKNSKIDESSRLAQQVHNSIISEADKRGFTDIKNLGVKQAPFYVLIGAQMPAILIELAFISNEKDLGNLKNSTFLEMLTKEITEGIRAYVSDTTAQL